MNQPPGSLELQNNVQSLGPTPNAKAGPVTHAPDPFMAASAVPSSAASSAGNSSTRPNVPKRGFLKLPLFKSLLKWWPELIGAFSSILLLGAIIAFLAVLDGSKLDDWHLAWQIKPPTIVSILVTLCRINLAFFIAEGIGQLKWVFFEQREHQLSDFEKFDEATRGPWGAVCFIWKINRRAFVATFGAIMAILILAMDPFSQQVIYYAARADNVDGAIATVPSALFYDSGALYATLGGENKSASFDPDPESSSTSTLPPTDNGLRTFGQPISPSTLDSTPVASEVPGLQTFGGSGLIKRDESGTSSSPGGSNCSDTLMARAAYSGLFTSIPPLEFACATGNNCTWPSFTTLGVCSECKNITARTERSCHTTTDYDICWYELIGPGDLPGNASYPTGVNADLPSIIPGNSSTKFESRCSHSGVTWWPLLLTWTSNVWDKSRDLLSFTSYRFPKKSDARRFNCRLPEADVEQCTLFWCAKTFDSAAATNGKMNEGSSTDVRLVPFDATNTTCTGLQTIKAPERKEGISMQGLVREDKSCPMSSDEIDPSDTFWVNKNDHIMTVNMLSPMVYAKQMIINQQGATYNGKAANAGSDAAILTAMWDNHGGNLSLTMADIAAAMTTRVRLADGHVNVTGSSTTSYTAIVVNWYWLVYMVAMVLLSLAFFVTAMVFASEKSEVVWKSSILAVLMHGLQGFDRSQLEHRTLNEMSKEAKELWAQLREDDAGSLKLVQHR